MRLFILLFFSIFAFQNAGLAFEEIDTIPSKYKNTLSYFEVNQKPIYLSDSCIHLSGDSLKNCSESQMMRYVYWNIEGRHPRADLIDELAIVDIIIGKTGKIIHASMLKTPMGVQGRLEKNLLEVVKKLEFTPAIHQGKPVEVRFFIPVRYL